MDAVLARAETLLDLRRPGEAERLARDHAASHPDSPEALNLLCRALNAQQRHAEAEQAIRAAMTLDPGSAHHVFQLAHTLSQLGRHRQAVDMASELMQMQPGEWSSHYILAEALLSGRRPRTRDAHEAARRARDLAPWNAATHNLVGMCAADLGLGKDAEAAYREALRLDPQDSFAMNNLAALRLHRGDFVGAGAGLTAAAQNTPAEKTIQHNLDILVVKWVQRLLYVQIGLLCLLGVSLAASLSWWMRAFAGLTFLAALAWHTRRFTQALPRGFRLGTPLIRRISWSAKRIVILSWIGTFALLVMCFAPFDISALAGMLFLLLLKTVGLLVVVAWILLLPLRLLRRGSNDVWVWHRIRERRIGRRRHRTQMR